MSGEDDDGPLKALAKRLRRPVDSLLAQSSSTDPYSVDTPYRRVPAEWFARLSCHALYQSRDEYRIMR